MQDFDAVLLIFLNIFDGKWQVEIAKNQENCKMLVLLRDLPLFEFQFSVAKTGPP